MKFTRVIAAAALCAATSAPLAAHHSASMFDDAKVVELNGTIKEMQWTNPHVWIQVVVDNNGQKAEWSVEGGSPNTLSRNGWRSTTFMPPISTKGASLANVTPPVSVTRLGKRGIPVQVHELANPGDREPR